MKMLHNRVNREELKKRLYEEDFRRTTLSFYRYFKIQDPRGFRNKLYLKWSALNCFGRIYVASEGINAQMSVPEEKMQRFLEQLNGVPGLQGIPVKYALEDDGRSFFKLTIKVREKIVADGMEPDAFDTSNVGTHLTALEFHRLSGDPDTLVVDMRNHYEFEVGHFVNAVHSDADTFREALQRTPEMLGNEKDRKILLYCTGGIRCEKASAFLKHRGFSKVYQLHGGIIEYARQVRDLEMESRFTGKNFVFDERLGESVDGRVIAECHQCGAPCDDHTNCANDDCHRLFIQCPSCRTRYEGCCSDVCREIRNLDPDAKVARRPALRHHYAKGKIFKRFRAEVVRGENLKNPV